ncbi:uncharacterized protein LOC127095416 [Lathyrus oleraceus]|uniref:uncharacterized protein LOC127095416 n=1 Tax=Pisum sativum TaxID=3888 RepID=UPI0021CEA50C|nr:uncharacterized protein LOC127095416 [Pisum sativum]
MLDDNSYVSRHRTCEDVVIVIDIFWTHPDSIKLFNMFPIVLILDSTYKTNKYRLPLLEMSEKEENVTWALEVCRTLLKDQGEMPKVIVISDNALMNSVAKVFPTSNALLYRYHMTKNVRSRVKPAVKEKIVFAWTDKVRHLGNTTTNRVESAHATLKNWLENSKNDLCRDWDSMNQMIQNQYNEIQTSFGWSIIVFQHGFKNNNLYSQLVDNISRAGLNYICHEAKRADNVSFDSAKCGGIIVKTHGLSCACVIAKKDETW